MALRIHRNRTGPSPSKIGRNNDRTTPKKDHTTGKKKTSTGARSSGSSTAPRLHIGAAGVKNRLKIKIAIKLALPGDFPTSPYDGIHHVHGMYVVDGTEAHILKDSRKRKSYGSVSYKDDARVDSCPRVLETHETDGKPHTHHMVDEYTRAVTVDLLPGLPR